MVGYEKIFLVACAPKEKLAKEHLQLDLQDIVKVTGQTQMAENLNDREPRALTTEETEELVKQLNSITLTKTMRSGAKGWEYRFVITLQDGTIKDIAISGEKMQIDDKEYKMKGYDKDSLLSLFE